MPKRLPLVLLLLTLACGGGSNGGSQQTVDRDTLTQRQKDSILAQSKIPGARAVRNAMTAADSTSARIQQANAVATDTQPR
ncbi:MAG TPA: hypothetical protein VGQ25_03665 [Gemmatimonadales bacterium]|jgi:hypothetical protein|nr:hypothetical protein [Gemmatimonadales bacterium]